MLPYGSWPSPLSAEAVTAGAPRLDGARFVGADAEIWWGVSVPAEGGRTAVRRRTADDAAEDVLPAPWNARSTVHEYGGGAWTTSDDGELLFVEKSDQRIWAMRIGAEPRPLTAETAGIRHGGLSFQSGRLLAIRETDGPGRTPRREIVAVPLDGSAVGDAARVRVLATGSDFLAQPALSPDGGSLAWIAWDHPDMPWDRTRLLVRDLETDAEETIVVGETAPLQPVWAASGDLFFVDDPSGRWNLFRWNAAAGVSPVAPADADTGGPLWNLGMRWFGVSEGDRILAVHTNGRDELAVIDAETAQTTAMPVPLTAEVTVADVRGSRALVIGAGIATPAAVWIVDLEDPESAAPITPATAEWDESWLPEPRTVRLDGPDGAVHAYDYPPTNPDVCAPDDELPPYIVRVHGGPTSHVAPSANAKIAYFTSRGIGVLDVNYGGSTGYGRAYRERLRGQWGIVDVEDVARAAAGLAAAVIADPDRLAIEGGSAGGWTVLAALTRTDVFSAGVSRYGVGDARALAADTHDFEAHYLDGLIGPLPDAEEIYRERSPLSHPERFRVPLLLLQGAEDAVVPPSQAESIREALRAQGVPHGYVVYEGEGHGFRRRETLVHALESELAFLGEVFGFDTPDVPPFALEVG